MKKEIELHGVTDYKADNNDRSEILPSRRSRHQKPLTFLEKPAFSLIVFILFILIIGSIFFYFKYMKTNPVADKQSISNESIESNLTEENTNTPGLIKADNNQLSPTVSVVNTSEPIITDNAEENPGTAVDEVTNNEQSNNETTKSVTHLVVENDTLYRLSIKYYGSSKPEYRQKIMEANHLKDENIVLNSKLIIPDPILNP